MIESNDIKTRISIVKASINLYKTVVEKSVVFDETHEYQKGLNEEIKYLQKLKNEYPEYFV